MTSKTHLALVPARSTEGGLQGIDNASAFITREPAIPLVGDRITARWLNGAHTLSLSKEFTTRREFVEAAARSGANRIIERQRAEIARLRGDMARMDRRAA